MKLQASALNIQDDTVNDDRSHPVATFSKFPRLPAEMREAIWEIALPESRLFVPYIDIQEQMCLTEYYKPPSIRGVCKESWHVTEKHGGFEFGTQETRTYGIWFNYSKDVVVWHKWELDDDFHLTNIQNIAIEWHHFSNERDCIATLKWALSEMRRCRKIIVTILPHLRRDPDELENSTVRLFSISDTEVMWGFQGNRKLLPSLPDDKEATWADVKEGLGTLYRKRKTLGNLGIDAEDLPILEAKELLISG